APMMGTKLVMPGPNLDGESLISLFNQEKVTVSAGVPTIWAGLIAYLEQSGKKIPHLQRTVVGGSACPPSTIEKFRETYDVEVLHAWGMTELSPLGTVNNLKNKHDDLPADAQENLRCSQGRPPFGIELGVFDDDDNRLPEDGEAQGNLYCRGFWVLDKYYSAEGDDPKRGNWFPTGDVATVDHDGFMTIRDRSKDIIKSGGEWISTVELENLALGHPAIADAAVIAAQHPKWDERPLLLLVQKPGASFTHSDMIKLYEDKVAKWWVPDAFRIIDEIPRNATGKVRKNVLRETYGKSLLDDASSLVK
ncbi:MAG: AMP-binding protein, partial [Rhizobiaceae bacterium]